MDPFAFRTAATEGIFFASHGIFSDLIPRTRGRRFECTYLRFQWIDGALALGALASFSLARSLSCSRIQLRKMSTISTTISSSQLQVLASLGFETLSPAIVHPISPDTTEILILCCGE
jgi:hypothetical protein